MKQALTWGGISIVAFIGFTIMIFIALKWSSPAEESVELAAARVSKKVFDKRIQMYVSERDSLVRLVQNSQAESFLIEVTKDSLFEQNAKKDRLIGEYKKLLSNKDQEIIALTRQKTSSKELAKTYESMKPDEMRPILAKVDNKTIVKLYESMSSRKRKSLLQALSVERAAILTKKMAGT